MRRLVPVSLLALGPLTVTWAVNLQAPLYDAHAEESDVGATAVTVRVRGLRRGLVQTLLLLGRLSDRIGQRVPIALALIPAAIATAFIVQGPSWTTLVVALGLLWVGTGLATIAGTAYLTEIGLDRAKRTALIVETTSVAG